MATETILQHWIITKFIVPFLLIFFIVFAILEKTNIFGKGKKQINAMLSFVIGLIFVGAVFPKEFVSNIILFLTVSLVVVFVILLLWGFAVGEDGPKFGNGMKKFVGVIIGISVLFAVLYFANFLQPVYDFLFRQDWSKSFWTNIVFIGVLAGAVAFALKGS